MAFYQDPPRLGNQYESDPLLREYLRRVWPADALAQIEPELCELGDEAVRLYELQLADRLNEPRLTQWDAWGRRIDLIETTPLWREAHQLAARHGLVALGYERRHAELSRVHQFALNYLVEPSLDVYSCPLAMTDGAARTLLDLQAHALAERALPRLLSRDPASMWTSGQWMTERSGGSDVGASETVARESPGGWRLFGTKWFTSATNSQMALTLARPEGNPPGSKGLALFYLELRDEQGRWNRIQVNRLKDKLGTRKVPTAELTLDGALATPVAGLSDGVRKITPMLRITRVWNAVCAVAGMRRAIALARDYAERRAQFGSLLRDKPLHRDTLAGLQAELEGAFLLAFRTVELLGLHEAGAPSERDELLLRLLTPLAKLTTAKQAVAIASEAIECFGGAGYVEDTGLPRLLRDAQVLPIWEGTTNVLSLDTLRALRNEGTLEALGAEIERHLGQVRHPSLGDVVTGVRGAFDRARAWLSRASAAPEAHEAGARGLALTLGRASELALLASHAQWTLDNAGSGRAASAARRLLRHGVDRTETDEGSGEDARLLAQS